MTFECLINGWSINACHCDIQTCTHKPNVQSNAIPQKTEESRWRCKYEHHGFVYDRPIGTDEILSSWILLQ